MVIKNRPVLILIRYAGAFLALGVFWQLGTVCFGENVLPAPLSVVALFAASLADPEYLHHASVSAFRLASGLTAATAVAFPLGLWLGHSKRADALLSPLVFITYPLPKIVLLPVFFVLLGLGESPRLLLIALTGGYQILIIVRESARALDRVYAQAVGYMGGGTADLVRHVYVPAALPSLLTGLKVAVGTGIAVLFLAESFATDAGLGFLIMDAWGIGDSAMMFNGILGMAALGLIFYALLWMLERLLCPWKRQGRA